MLLRVRLPMTLMAITVLLHARSVYAALGDCAELLARLRAWASVRITRNEQACVSAHVRARVGMLAWAHRCLCAHVRMRAYAAPTVSAQHFLALLAIQAACKGVLTCQRCCQRWRKDHT
eukprot:579958-Pleurochrysis_carterae.AAC.1